MTKIFCDIADIELIKKFTKKKIVKGFTTNPSLMRKAGVKNYENYSKKTIKELNNADIKLNITAVYSAKETKKILKIINKKTKVIISIFAGRAADSGNDPVPEFERSIKLSKKYRNVEILWASVREPYNYLQAKKLGCHIITVPPNIIDKIQMFGKSLNSLMLETVKTFLADSKKSKFKL